MKEHLLLFLVFRFVRCFNGNVLTSESKHEETLPSQNASLSPLWEHQMCVLIDQADVSKGI